MNLYKITFSHTSQKSQEKGIKGYIIANNDEHVFNYIDKEYNYGIWKDTNEDGETYCVFDKENNLIGKETFKDKIIRIKGDQNDKDYDFSDAYYGITLYGWELIKENVKENYLELIQLGVFTKL